MKIVALILLLAASSFGQKSIDDLKPAHATALKRYLKQDIKVAFRPELYLEKDGRKNADEWLGKDFMPNYAFGDFNSDRIEDFAVILERDGESGCQVEMSNADCYDSTAKLPDHYPDHPQAIVIFNGSKIGTYRIAFRHNNTGPNAAYLLVKKGNFPRLTYGILETDSDDIMFVPTRAGYKIKFIGL